ncbi:MAG TPA: PEP-CTERM sorting domain-containing protein, partial [Opitutales bacterium]|nr:PEP-CTERM sorting domain-containing protein [Opitutales bacterium]
PTYAGIVFVERNPGAALGTDLGPGRLVRAYDASDNLLETAFVGGSDPEFVEDGFVGLSTSTGISYITVDGDNEYDHFQYGFQAVPEPSAFGLIAGAFAFSWIALRRRRA